MLIISGGKEWGVGSLLRRFNLAIEMLIISGHLHDGLSQPCYTCFNLAIEMLIISGHRF